MTLLPLVQSLLKDPAELLHRQDSPADLARLAPPLLGITAAGAALFGLVVGTQKGGVQLVFAAAKMPALFLVPPLLALPAAYALWRACGVEVAWRRLSLAALAGMARSAILAAALSPLLWLPYSMDLDYHQAVVLLAAALIAAGLPGMVSFVRAVPAGGERRWIAAVGTVVVLGACLAQTGWLLRPFVARPTVPVTFLRPIESSVFSSLDATAGAATGAYQEWDARGEGLLGRSAE